MRAAKVQASPRIRAVSPEPSLLAHTSSESRGTFRQKARFLAPLNGWACAVEICHDGMLEDTNSLDGAQLILYYFNCDICIHDQCKTKHTFIILNICDIMIGDVISPIIHKSLKSSYTIILDLYNEFLQCHI